MVDIALRGVWKSFGTADVIRGLDLTIRDREFFTFVGPSGCGKSTILNLIAGLEEPTKGTILFDSEPVADLSPGRRDVAMVFQSYALYPHMTVFENIAFPLKVRKERREVVSREVGRVAELLGIGDQLGKLPRELSGGQRQRVALGRAIIRRPRAFLMDEPLSNLDARLRMEMRAEIKKLHRELGITTVYVTHDQEEAMSLSDRVAVLSEGEVRQCSRPGELYERPADVFVAGFIGSPPMNLFGARVTSEEPFRIAALGAVLSPDVSAAPSGGTVIAGIRPEDVEVDTRPLPGGLEAEVELTEPVGPYEWVDLNVGGVRLRARAEAGKVRAGQRVFFRVAEERLHVFDAETEKRL